MLWQGLAALTCVFLLLPGDFAVLAQGTTAVPTGTTEPAAVKLPADQLDSLVAPIALYPDPLLAQTLVAATYPLEMIQLQQWLKKNPGLKDKALTDAVAKQPWDPSVQSMAALPEVVKRLAEDIQWTTDLGNAFLAQQGDVMDAVQRMRKKAVDKGTLTPNENQKVETQVVGEKTVIVVESANPEIVYVPSYSPTVVYGPPVYPYYPYPPIYYPAYPPGAAFVSFSFGVMVGAAWGGYCCGMGWGGSDIDINVDNDFNRIDIDRGDGNRGDRGDRGRGDGGGSNKWQHNPQHRGAAPYADRATAGKYGGTARGEAPRSRQPGALQQPAGGGGRTASPGMSDRSAGGARPGSPGGGGGGSDRIGSYDIPKNSASRSSGFDGGSRGYNGGSARASSSRGASSMGGRGGGGRRR